MIDYNFILRKAYATALDGNITYDGDAVPVIDEKLDQLNVPLYVRISTQQAQEQDNKHHWAASCLLNIDIVQRTDDAVSKIAIDDVSNTILGLLFPTKNTVAITLDAGLNLTAAKFVDSSTAPLKQTAEGFIIAKRLTFSNRVYQ